MTETKENILGRIRDRLWTGHNIGLGPGDATIDANVALISQDVRTLTIKALIRRSFDSSRKLRVLDLGALEGGLTLEMAREGWDAIGIEARRDNFEKAELIREFYGLGNLRFEHRDVKSLSREQDGVFDVILCCGLLYHLDQPFAMLDTLAEMTASRGMLFLDTHVAPDRDAGLGTWTGALSDPSSLVHGARQYEGRWFVEPTGGSVLDRQWSATSNERSFWPTRRALIRGVYHAGFHSISELFGMFEIDAEFGLRDEYSRLYLACMREWSS